MGLPGARFPLNEVKGARGPLILVEPNHEGLPVAAIAARCIAAPRERVWGLIADVGNYAGHVPMLSHVTRNGDRVKVDLRFRIALFSVGFSFVADAVYEEGRWLELRYVSGEPRDLCLRFELEPDGDNRTLIHAAIGFDVLSLGWLVRFFLKHHPEIRFGVFPGAALVLVESMRRAAEGGAPIGA
jgi:hypothetical protein